MGNMVHRTFSPFINGKQIGVNDYLDKYPELKDNEDCSKLNSIELMWCWYYGSSESLFVKSYDDKKKRAYAITDYLFSQNDVYIEKKTKEELYAGNISHLWYKVIDFFKSVNTDIRLGAKLMVEQMYEQYKYILGQGTEAFNEDGVINWKEYTATTIRIKDQLPDIIKTIEMGFGVSSSLTGRGIIDELAIYESWIKNKR